MASSLSAADAFTWALRLLSVAARHHAEGDGWGAASAEMALLMNRLPRVDVVEVAEALALLPGISGGLSWLPEPGRLAGVDELNRLKAEIAWTWSDA